MVHPAPRLVIRTLTLALVTTLSAGVWAQDGARESRRGASQPTPRRPVSQPGPRAKTSMGPSKRRRDAKDDALFGDDGKPNPPPRAPVSTAGPWPAEDDSPWPTETGAPWPAEEDAEFDELDERGPEATREAERRGSTRSPAPASRPRPAPPDWRITHRHHTPSELATHEGGDVPRGYVKATRVRKGWLIGGAVTLGVGWLSTAAYGAYLGSARDAGFWRGDSHERARSEAVLYIPLAGPWIALGTVEHDRQEGAAFVAGGIVQAGGLAMLIGGLAAKRTVLVKTAAAEVALAPSVGPSGMGATVSGSF